MNGNTKQRPFTKLDDEALKDLGLVHGAVLGAVLRYCSMSEGICRASVRTIGRRIHLCESATHRGLRRLVKDGYLEDLTPGLRYVPHRYRGTGKATAGRKDEQRASVLDENASVPEKNATVLQENASVLDAPMNRLLRDKQDTPEDTTRGACAPQPAAGGGVALKPGERPELWLFEQAAGFAPRKQTIDDVIAAVRQIGRRLGRAAEPDDLQRFIRAWVGRGWNPYNLTWLYDWAVQGEIPEPDSRQAERKAEHGINLLGSRTAPPARDELSPAERERLIEFYNGPRKT
jgi:hypothetical protein